MAASRSRPLARAFGGDGRVAAHDQPLAGKLGRADLSQRVLVKQAQREVGAGPQLGDLGRAQRADEPDLALLEVADLRVGEHAAIAHDHGARDPEALRDGGRGGRHGRRVAAVAGVQLDRDRPSVRGADQPVVDLQAAAPAIARVADLRQRAAAPLHIRRGQVVEHVPVGGQVPARERALDPALALQQPVHRSQELALGHRPQVELVGQRGLAEAARCRQLRTRGQQPLADQRHAQIALTAALAREQPLEIKRAQHAQHGGHVPVPQRALDPQSLAGRDQRLAAQHTPDRVDRLRRQMRQVRQRLLAHPRPLAVAAPDQHRLVLAIPMPPLARDHMHRAGLERHCRIIAQQPDGSERYS